MSTSLTEVWGVVKAISGKNVGEHKIVLFDNGSIADPLVISNMFGAYFSLVSSSRNYNAEFLIFKEQERNIIIFPPSNGEFYNSSFTLKELDHAIKHTTSTSPGPDEIHYDMLKNLPLEQKLNLLAFFNYLWNNNLFPSQWSEAVVLPFLKPNKPKHLTSSYRPIALTSCLCKTWREWFSLE